MSERDIAKEAAREINEIIRREFNGSLDPAWLASIITRVVLEPEREKYKKLVEAGKAASNILWLLEAEVDALGLRADKVRGQLNAALAALEEVSK